MMLLPQVDQTKGTIAVPAIQKARATPELVFSTSSHIHQMTWDGNKPYPLVRDCRG